METLKFNTYIVQYTMTLENSSENIRILANLETKKLDLYLM